MSLAEDIVETYCPSLSKPGTMFGLNIEVGRTFDTLDTCLGTTRVVAFEIAQVTVNKQYEGCEAVI